MEQTIFDRKAYAAKAREAVAEGSVLLRNEAHTLPFAPGTRLAVFGRSQFNYYKKRDRLRRTGEHRACSRDSGSAGAERRRSDRRPGEGLL